MSLPPIDSFYAAHPAFKARAENDPSFDGFVKGNVQTIQDVFHKIKEIISCLKLPAHKTQGAQTLQGSVLTIIQVPTLDFCSGHFHLALVPDDQTPALSNENYTRRVDELSEKIDQSVDRILSGLTCERLSRHLTLASSGMIVNIFAQSHAAAAGVKFLGLAPVAVNPDEVEIVITRLHY